MVHMNVCVNTCAIKIVSIQKTAALFLIACNNIISARVRSKNEKVGREL